MKLALIAVVIGAFVYGAGAVLQSFGASQVPAVNRESRGIRGLLAIARQLPFVAGLACDLLGWVLSLIALRHLPLFEVQAILAGSLAVTVVLAHYLLKAPLHRSDIASITLAVVALAVIAASAGTEGIRHGHRGMSTALVIGVVGLAVLGLTAVRMGSSIVISAVAGVSFGGTALSARVVHVRHGVIGVLGQPVTVALVAYGALGIVLYTVALRRGHVGPVTATMWVAQIIVPAIVGLALLGDSVRPGWEGVALAAMGAAIVAVIFLARSPAQVEAHHVEH